MAFRPPNRDQDDDRPRSRGNSSGGGKRPGPPPTDAEVEDVGLQGQVSRLVAEKGFGFVKCLSNQREYFFHRSGVIGNYDNLYEGQQVTFDGMKSNKGPRAQDVKPVE